MPAKIIKRFQCPKCHLVESQEFTYRESKLPLAKVCWFCLSKGETTVMEEV